MKIPYLKQEAEHTCGPACMRMALATLKIKKSEKELARELKTSKKTGTEEENFSKVVLGYKLKFFEKNKSSIKELKKFLEKGYIIIVEYYHAKEKEEHYAIVKKINSKTIYLIDPWEGPNKSFSLRYFKIVWSARNKKKKRWFFAIKK